MTQPQPVEEVWIFGGTRCSSGKRVHAWLPSESVSVNEELYFRPSGSHAVGSEYTVRVTRAGDTVTKHGIPVYHGQHSSQHVRAILESRHRAAQTRLRLAALERNDKRRCALDAVLQPVCDLVQHASPAERDAILTYILRRLSRAW